MMVRIDSLLIFLDNLVFFCETGSVSLPLLWPDMRARARDFQLFLNPPPPPLPPPIVARRLATLDDFGRRFRRNDNFDDSSGELGGDK